MQKLEVFPFKKRSNMADNYEDVGDMHTWNERLSVDMKEKLETLGLRVNLTQIRDEYRRTAQKGLKLVIFGAQTFLMHNIPQNTTSWDFHFGRNQNANVLFKTCDENFKCSSDDALIKTSMHGYTSNLHSKLQVDMSVPSHPVFTLFDLFSDERRKTKVYNSAGEKSSLLTGGIVVESNDVIHFMPIYPHVKYGLATPNYEFGFLVLLWDPEFDLQSEKHKLPSREPSKKCPTGDNILLTRVGDNDNPKLMDVIAEELEDKTCIEIREGRQKLTLTPLVGSIQFELEDYFTETDPTSMLKRSTTVYTGAGIVVAQLNAEKRSTKLLVGDIMCFRDAPVHAVYELRTEPTYP